jgi:hypothetical protein
MLLAARQLDAERMLAIADTLKYAFGFQSGPAELLIPATFSTVYDALLSNQYVMQIENFFSFYSWDRAKTLRFQLVDTYMRSDWPAGDLLIIANQNGIGRKVLARVQNRWRGAKYILSIEADLAERRPSGFIEALADLTEFRLQPFSDEEWE